MAGGEYSCSAY